MHEDATRSSSSIPNKLTPDALRAAAAASSGQQYNGQKLGNVHNGYEGSGGSIGANGGSGVAQDDAASKVRGDAGNI